MHLIAGIKPVQSTILTNIDITNDSKMNNSISSSRRSISSVRRSDENQEKLSASLLQPRDGFVMISPLVPSDCNYGDGLSRKGEITEQPTKPTRNSSVRSVLSESITSSKFSNGSVASLIENALANITVDGCKESKLAQVLLGNENEQVSTEDAFVASVTDIMNLQNNFCKADRELKETVENNSVLVSDKVALQTELIAAQNELAELRKANEELLAQKQKMAANLKKKKDLLAEADNKINRTTKTIEELEQEKGNLLQGIHKLTSNRDELKTKLRCKNEIAREQRTQVDRLERRLKTTQNIRKKEVQLLQLYRQLSLHTGYFKWGKQIRVLEADLEATMEREDSETSY